MKHEDGRRAALSRAVAVCRRALVGDRTTGTAGDLGKQLESPNGFDRVTGAPVPLEGMIHLRSWEHATARMLREWHAHLSIGAAGATEAERTLAAYDQMKYELGYTVLHRLCALRMAEERGVVRECVRRGRDSTGFRTYVQLAGDSGLGTHEDAYTFFLARLYDELGRDLPAVFDRRTAASLLTPSAGALATVLTAINDPVIATLWTEDETLGWVFEDYNDADERKEMREHDAPRNARELAVRNQFFTPRWVVEFLTDNTLGRLWYDLTGGETRLADSCRFLLKPTELPVRGCRDPRSLKVLDPACGSGHFLLYVYDLLETIYREAWSGRHHQSPGLKPLWEEFPDNAAFEHEIPSLILAHNLYGVDIDPRCIQEAALALWLRVHRSWQAQGLRPNARPRISRVNLVCAQTPPNTPEQRDRLRTKLKPAILGKLVDSLFQNVAEMGLLLRADTAIRDTVEAVRTEYLLWKKGAPQRDLFGQIVGSRQTTLDDFAKLRDEGGESEFWREADQLLILAIEDLAEEDEEAEYYRTRLFADGMRNEVEFFEVGRQRYDVVLMNPPFGVPSKGTQKALAGMYADCGGDLYAMFYQRALELLTPTGRVGAITNRTWLGIDTQEGFRTRVLGRLGRVECLADLGSFVLNAQVEVAAAVVAPSVTESALVPWIRLLKTGRKSGVLAEAAQAVRDRRTHPALHWSSTKRFQSLPGRFYGYWMSDALIALYDADNTLAARGIVARMGAETGSDSTHLRLTWELPADCFGKSQWMRIAKGGEYRAYWDDIHLAIRTRYSHGVAVTWRRGRLEWFGDPGVTWPLRTTSRLSVRALPNGVAFANVGPSAQSDGGRRPLLLALLNSRPAFLLLSPRLGAGDDAPGSAAKLYEIKFLRELPWPSIATDRFDDVGASAAEAVELVRLGQVEEDDTGETAVAFSVPPALLTLPNGSRPESLADATSGLVCAREMRLARLSAIQAEIDDAIASAYGFSERDRQVMDEELEPPLANLPGTELVDENEFRTAYLTKGELDGDKLPGGREAEVDVRTEHRRKKQVRLRDETTLCRIFHAPPARIAELRERLGLLRDEDQERVAADLVSYAVGVAFGRWDVRLWAHAERIPTFADAFDPMPACPIGQLVNGEGLPATEDRIASEGWLAARKHPAALPPSSEVTAREYPLAVAWDGPIEDDTLDDTRPRPPEDSLRARVEAVLEYLFGARRAEWEHDIAAALGAESIAAWLRAPAGFFADHLGRYSKSRRQAPIYWPLSTASGGLVFWIYAPRFDIGTLPSVVNRLHTKIEVLRDQRDRLQRGAGSDASRLAQLRRIELEIKERRELGAQLQSVLDWGYVPHPDDGFVVTASPLSFAFRLAKWRDLLSASWKELEAGDSDWAHLALTRRPREVLAKCATHQSLAIAHGREDVFTAPANKKAGRKSTAAGAAKKSAKGARATQLTMPVAADEGES